MKRLLKRNTKTHLFIYLFYIDLNNILNVINLKSIMTEYWFLELKIKEIRKAWMCDSSNDSQLYYSRLQMISFSKNLYQRGDGGIYINKERLIRNANALW